VFNLNKSDAANVIGNCGMRYGDAVITHQDVDDLREYLARKFGEAVKFKYVDITSDDMKDYPGIIEILDKVRLPLIVVNGEPLFQGGFSFTSIEGAISSILK